MPKVLHSSVFEYKNRISDLECEVSTLKRRLDELRRAKHQAYIKQKHSSSAARRISICQESESNNHSEPAAAADTEKDIAALKQRVTRLQNELELSELRYIRDTTAFKSTIKKLQDEMGGLREAHQLEIQGINTARQLENTKLLENMKRTHTEELALYSERTERALDAQTLAESQLAEYKHKMRGVSMPDVEHVRTELNKFQEAYAYLKIQHESEVQQLEERIAELLAQISVYTENSKRKYQLIPDRTYIVKKASPTVSQSSIGAVPKTEYSLTKAAKSPPPSDPYDKYAKSTSPTRSASVKSPKNNSEEGESTRPARPKSCIERTSSARISANINFKNQPNNKPVFSRPKSCWGDKRNSDDKKITRPVTAATIYKSHKFSSVSSKIDSGKARGGHDAGVAALPESIAKYRTVGNFPPWHKNRGFTTKNFF